MNKNTRQNICQRNDVNKNTRQNICERNDVVTKTCCTPEGLCTGFEQLRLAHVAYQSMLLLALLAPLRKQFRAHRPTTGEHRIPQRGGHALFVFRVCGGIERPERVWHRLVEKARGKNKKLKSFALGNSDYINPTKQSNSQKKRSPMCFFARHTRRSSGCNRRADDRVSHLPTSILRHVPPKVHDTFPPLRATSPAKHATEPREASSPVDLSPIPRGKKPGKKKTKKSFPADRTTAPSRR